MKRCLFHLLAQFGVLAFGQRSWANAGPPLRLAGMFDPELRDALTRLNEGLLLTWQSSVPFPRPALVLGKTPSPATWTFTAGFGTS